MGFSERKKFKRMPNKFNMKFFNRFIGFCPWYLRKIICLWFIKRKRLRDFPFSVDLYGYKFRGNAVNLIDYHILSRGCFEPGLTLLMQYIGKSCEKPALLLDVGANVGVHSIASCTFYEKVISVEPNPDLVKRLHELIEVNDISNISIISKALSEKPGTANFTMPPKGNLGVGKIDKTNDSGDNSFEVNIVTGDEIISSQTLPLLFLKIDVEGHEVSVLKGLNTSLLEHRPFIVLEILSVQKTSEIKSIIPKNYTIYEICRINKKNFYLMKMADERSGDLLLCPEEKVDVIRKFVKG
jgi:FkbM family methyltransferase